MYQLVFNVTFFDAHTGVQAFRVVIDVDTKDFYGDFFRALRITIRKDSKFLWGLARASDSQIL